MCGRIRKGDEADEDFATIFTDMSKVFKLEPGLRFNVPPGTTPMVIHELASIRTLERQFWGYAPPWYKRSPVSNARLDKILDNSPFWKAPTAHGRMIVPADGWFEWTGEKGDKQPWFIRPADSKPILMAATPPTRGFIFMDYTPPSAEDLQRLKNDLDYTGKQMAKLACVGEQH